MNRVTTVTTHRTGLATKLEDTSDAIDEIVARDIGTGAERYIVFLADEADGLPESTLALAERCGLSVRSMERHAIEYKHRDTRRRASFLFRRE